MLQVLFSGNNSPGVSGSFNNNCLIKGLEGRHIQNAAVYAFSLQIISSFKGCRHHSSNSDNGYLFSPLHSYCLTQLKAVVIVIDQGHFKTAQPDVKGTIA
ncbi:hypothetical protein ES705_50962 [subsurface metagenome]